MIMNMAFATINPFSFPEIVEEILMTPISTNPHNPIRSNAPVSDFLENFDKFLDTVVHSNITSSSSYSKSLPYRKLDDTNGAIRTKYKAISIPYVDGVSKDIHLVYNIVHDRELEANNTEYPPSVFNILRDEMVILTHAILGEAAAITQSKVVYNIKKQEDKNYSSVLIMSSNPVFVIVDRLYEDFVKLYNFIYFNGVDCLDEQQTLFRVYSVLTAIYKISNKISNELNIATQSYDDQDIFVLDRVLATTYSKVVIHLPTNFINGKKLKTYIEKRDESIVSEVLARPKYMEEASLILSMINTQYAFT